MIQSKGFVNLAIALTTHMVKISVRSGRHLNSVPADMRSPVRMMEALSPLASKNLSGMLFRDVVIFRSNSFHA